MHTSRAWRDIIARIQAGYGHTAEGVVEPGALAIFCPACPQPGVNLPDDLLGSNDPNTILDPTRIRYSRFLYASLCFRSDSISVWT